MSDLVQPKNAHVEQRLRSDYIVWLNSVRPDGRPHSVPVWFLWDGSTFLIFSIPNNQKIRNLQHNPHVVVTLDDTKHGDDVTVVEGKAELLNDANLSTTLSAYAEKYAPLLKEMGWTPESMAADYSQAIRVTPTKFLGF